MNTAGEATLPSQPHYAGYSSEALEQAQSSRRSISDTEEAAGVGRGEGAEPSHPRLTPGPLLTPRRQPRHPPAGVRTPSKAVGACRGGPSIRTSLPAAQRIPGAALPFQALLWVAGLLSQGLRLVCGGGDTGEPLRPQKPPEASQDVQFLSSWMYPRSPKSVSMYPQERVDRKTGREGGREGQKYKQNTEC